MKKFILTAALATAILASCTKNEVKVTVPDQAISFTTAVGANSTKAMIDGTNYTSSDPAFGTFAFYLQNGEWDTDAASSQRYIFNEKVTWHASDNGNNWTTETPYYWPKEGSLTFFSYSPYDELAMYSNCTNTNGLTITEWNVDANQTVDVMVADVQVDQKQNSAAGEGGNGTAYNGVPTVFRHKLAQIVNFSLLTETPQNYAEGTTHKAGTVLYYLDKITINNVYAIGTYTSGTDVCSTQPGSWSTSGNATSYVWYDATTQAEKQLIGNTATTAPKTGTYVADNGYLLVLPQSFASNDNASITIEYTIRTYNGTGANDYSEQDLSFTKKLNELHHGTGWQMNKKISYDITLGALDQIYWAPSVVDWESESHSFNDSL